MVRPRKSTPQKDEEIIALGEDLVKWATEETEEKRTSFVFWYSLKHMMLREHWKNLKKIELFRPYYEQARAALANKIHKNELEKGMAHRYIRMYDLDVTEQEDKDADREAERKKATEEKLPANTDINALIEQLLKENADLKKQIKEKC
ncbi:MAG: hypothetical protein PQJ44_06845 [Sphaerochaetaceae bacterium]|nr:hypothetical protein [Sphaerochaetaceae bacterium]